MQSLNADGRHFAELRVLSHDFYKKKKTMAIEGLDLTAKQRMMIDDAADRVFTSQFEPFYKYIDDVLRAYREIRDSDVRHACHVALLRYGRGRVIAQTDLFAAGSVRLPQRAAWLEDFTAELLAFPGRHDDQVDALTQGLAWGRQRQGEVSWGFARGMY